MGWKLTTRKCRIMAVAVAATLAALTFASVGPVGATGAAGHQTPGEPEPPAVTLRGFLRERDAELTVAEPPGATATKPGGLNNRGELVFKYLDTEGTQHGAVLSRGRYRPVEVPGASVTAPLSQNDRGEIVGNYLDAAGASHGFLRTSRGTYSTIDHPDASGTVLDTPGTIVTNINNRGEMVGIYAAEGRLVGFVRDRHGHFTTIDRPGSAATYLGDINDRGQVVGGSSQVGAEELLLGSDIDAFVLQRGVYTSVEVPGAVGTALNGINNRGEMAGTSIDSQGTSHGFLRTSGGRYTIVDHPHATALGTALYSINDRGQTTGAYQSSIAQAQQPQASPAPTGPLSADMGWMASPDTPDGAGPPGPRLPRSGAVDSSGT
jgi:hypothetical protein